MELYYLIAIIDRDRAARMTQLYQAAGARTILTKLGRGTATSELLSVYGLDEPPTAVVGAVAGADGARQIFRAARRKLLIDVPGNGILMTVPIKSVAGGRTLAYLTENTSTGGTPSMEFSHELIIVVLNEGYSDYVMDLARAAGAAGGTVLHAKGTGVRQDERFFGVRLADEKDMIYIVARAGEKAAIMRAINDGAGPGTKPGAICFSLPVSAIAGLREKED